MIQVENRRPANSISLECTQQEAEMREQHPTAISAKRQPILGQLVSVSIMGLFRFMRRVLALLFSGFIISLFHQRRKERRHGHHALVAVTRMAQMLADAEGIFHRPEQRIMIVRRGIGDCVRPAIGDDQGHDPATAGIGGA